MGDVAVREVAWVLTGPDGSVVASGGAPSRRDAWDAAMRELGVLRPWSDASDGDVEAANERWLEPVTVGERRFDSGFHARIVS